MPSGLLSYAGDDSGPMSSNLSPIAPSSGDHTASPPSRPAVGIGSGVAVESSPSSAPTTRGQAKVPRRATRVKPPKDSKMYKVALAVVALRATGAKMAAISETLGYSEDCLRQYLSHAYKRGWINVQSFDDPNDQLEFVLKNKVVRNINQFLDENDKAVTVEAAKGLGLFKAHQVVKGEGVANLGLALSVKVEMPPSPAGSCVTIRPGTIGGALATDIPVDAEIVETADASQ